MSPQRQDARFLYLDHRISNMRLSCQDLVKTQKFFTIPTLNERTRLASQLARS